MIRKTTTLAELLEDCPHIQLENTSTTVAMWLEAKLAERGIQLTSDTRFENQDEVVKTKVVTDSKGKVIGHFLAEESREVLGAEMRKPKTTSCQENSTK